MGSEQNSAVFGSNSHLLQAFPEKPNTEHSCKQNTKQIHFYNFIILIAAKQQQEKRSPIFSTHLLLSNITGSVHFFSLAFLVLQFMIYCDILLFISVAIVLLWNAKYKNLLLLTQSDSYKKLFIHF